MFSIIFCFFSLFLSLSCFSFVSFYLYKKRLLLKTELERELAREEAARPDPSALKQSLERIVDRTREECEKSRTQLTHSLLLEILPPDSAKWVSLLGSGEGDLSGSGGGDGGGDGGGGDCGADSGDSGVGEDQKVKKKKRRAKKKKTTNSQGGDGSGLDSGPPVKEELVCLYPFTSSSSATQRKIKQHYDQLVKCHESTKGLTLAQVGQFANCLIEAKNELKQKSDAIQRKYTITKALLNKAERSSFDRLRQQIYRLELEQKRLEDDTFVYNWLQQQLKLSPAYKKMLEVGADMELKAKNSELTESTDTEYDDISFEELLAREKKDSFWLKNGRRRSCSS
uniref:AT1G17665-like protein n=1 Tax=Pelargonium australe TaxID=59866 RepID=A0A0G4ANP4_9ROSI|nr:AT1G17665-like protein [Pelargonium australe]